VWATAAYEEAVVGLVITISITAPTAILDNIFLAKGGLHLPCCLNILLCDGDPPVPLPAVLALDSLKCIVSHTATVERRSEGVVYAASNTGSRFSTHCKESKKGRHCLFLRTGVPTSLTMFTEFLCLRTWYNARVFGHSVF